TGDEVKEIKKYIDDSFLAMNASKYTGALVVVQGKPSKDEIDFAARIAARYSKGREEQEVEVIYGVYGTKFEDSIKVSPITDEELQKYLIVIK
ncbi:hypothetical protein NQ665_18680, partial [Acinetobacter baumannii]|nr:hypothetical protein [Acinetobacter baumannii]